jgi:hypothetical protein
MCVVGKTGLELRWSDGRGQLGEGLVQRPGCVPFPAGPPASVVTTRATSSAAGRGASPGWQYQAFTKVGRFRVVGENAMVTSTRYVKHAAETRSRNRRR